MITHAKKPIAGVVSRKKTEIAYEAGAISSKTFFLRETIFPFKRIDSTGVIYSTNAEMNILRSATIFC